MSCEGDKIAYARAQTGDPDRYQAPIDDIYTNGEHLRDEVFTCLAVV